MIRCNGLYWTADFTLARSLGASYEAAGKSEVAYLCLGDPDHPEDQFAPYVGSELRKYYSRVRGTLEEPVTEESLGEAIRAIEAEWPEAFVICIEGGEGPAEHLGHIELTDRGLRRRPAGAEQQGLPPLIGDVGLCALLWSAPKGGARRKLDVNQLRRVADAVIDAQIRFLQKFGLYEPEL